MTTTEWGQWRTASSAGASTSRQDGSWTTDGPAGGTELSGGTAVRQRPSRCGAAHHAIRRRDLRLCRGQRASFNVTTHERWRVDVWKAGIQQSVGSVGIPARLDSGGGGPACGSDGRRLSGAASHGLRRSGWAAGNRRTLGNSALPGPVRTARFLPAALRWSRVDHRAADRIDSGPDGRRGRRPIRPARC